MRRLRAMGQPIRLFAETDKQCKVRLRALELMNEEAGVSFLQWSSKPRCCAASKLYALIRNKAVMSL